MLNFIFGKPSSGKTHTIMEKLKEYTKLNIPCVLIVPEQFAFENERLVLKTLGDKVALNVKVLSFTRLCDEIERSIGGTAAKTLGNYDRIIFMKKALLNVENELILWRKYVNNISFAQTMLDTVDEFKMSGVSAEELRQTAGECENSSLKSKLLDIATISDAYSVTLAEKYIDPTDRITRLVNTLADTDYFCGKAVFVDSFKGFTGQQYKILASIIKKAKDIFVAFTNDVENTNVHSIYANIQKSAHRLEKIAQDLNVEIGDSIILSKPYCLPEALQNVEKLMAGKSLPDGSCGDAVTLCTAISAADEAQFVARTIRRLVREENYRYRDFVIIARDADSYKQTVISACQKNGVKCFYDRRVSMSVFPLSRFTLSAIDALRLSTDGILGISKTGLGNLTTEEISDLENYTYLWNIDSTLWLDEWTMDPRGLVTNEMDDENRDKLKRLNILRKMALEPILKFKENFVGNARQRVEAIIKLFDDCDCSEKLRKMCDEMDASNPYLSEDMLIQSYDELMKIFDSIANSWGDMSINRETFREVLNLALNTGDIGVAPQTLDEVTFGSADRIRPSRPKVAFILGANQGVFPKTVKNSGILSLSDRKLLIKNFDIIIADNSLKSVIDEEFLVYFNLCCASEKLYVCCNSQSLSGEKTEPSAFFKTLGDKLSCNKVFEPMENLSIDNLPETFAAAFGEYCKKVRSAPKDALTIREALEGAKMSEDLDYCDSLSEDKQLAITPENAKALYGTDIRMSASRFDTYNRCHFSYFCKYGLGLSKLQPAEFDVMQRGTIAHFVLEKIITGNGEALARCDRAELGLLCDKYIEEYLSGVKGFSSIRNKYTDFLLGRISRSLKDVVVHVANEISQSEFKPTACELKIGEEGIPLEMKHSNGKIIFSGSVDRVDEYNGYIRVIDYKTGSRSFKLPDVLFGLNLQMLIYLYALTRGKGVNDSAAAGILYQPAKRDINDSGLAMNGLLPAEPSLIEAMEKGTNGEFVPKMTVTKSGSIDSRQSSFVDPAVFGEIFDLIERLAMKTGDELLGGDIRINPVDGRESAACKYCDFASVCGIENKTAQKVPAMTNKEVIEVLEKGGEESGS